MTETATFVVPVLRWLLVGLTIASLGIALWSLSWPRVKGTIEISIFDRKSVWNIRRAGSSGTRIEREIEEEHYLSYSYSVDGNAYAGSRISPIGFQWQVTVGGVNPVDSSARHHARWYREGAVVDVSYCPFLPQWSCLEPGGFVPAFILGAATVLVFVLT